MDWREGIEGEIVSLQSLSLSSLSGEREERHGLERVNRGKRDIDWRETWTGERE